MSYKNDEQIESATNMELFTWMANAIQTTTCIGHTKGDNNERYARRYREVLIARGVSVPPINLFGEDGIREMLYKLGQYNGEGSF